MYIIYDTDLFILNQKIKKLIASSEWKTGNHLSFSFVEDDWEAIKNHLVNRSLFSEKKVVVLKDAWFLTNAKPVGTPTLDLQKVVAVFQTHLASDVLVIFSLLTDKIHKQKKAAWFFDNCQLDGPKDYKKSDYENFVAKMFANHNQPLSPALTSLIVRRLPNEFQILSTECQKILHTHQIVTSELVTELLTNYAQVNIFKINSAIITNDLPNFLTAYQDYLQENQELIPLLVFLTNNLVILRNYYLLKRCGVNHTKIIETLNVNPYHLKGLLRDNKMDVSQLNVKINMLYDINRNLIANPNSFRVIPEYVFIKFFLNE